MLDRKILFFVITLLLIGKTNTYFPVRATENLTITRNKKISNNPRVLVDEVWQIINHQYLDVDFNGVDWQQVREDYVKNRSYSETEDAYKAIDSMIDLLGDPLTRFMTPEEFQAMRTSSGQTAGVGLQVRRNKNTEQIEVISALPNSPAFAVGVNYGDILTKIDDRDLNGMSVSEVISLLQGKPNTEVNLTISRNGREINLDIVRKIIKINALKSQIKEVEQGKIAYIKLTRFDEFASQSIANAIDRAEEQNVAAYVLDLRDNQGGLLYSAIAIADMWLNTGTIVSTIDRRGLDERKSAKDEVLTDKPLAVLVNYGTSSGSEILTAALQENERAIVIGEQTNGMGTIQSVRPLTDKSGLAVTIAKFLTPNGNDIQDKGIEPNLKIERSKAEKAEFTRNPQLLATQEDLAWTEAIKALQSP